MEQSQEPRTPQTDSGQFSSRLSESEVQGLHHQFRVSDEFFRMVLESLEEYAVFTTDTDGNISSWNSGAQRTSLRRSFPPPPSLKTFGLRMNFPRLEGKSCS